MFSEEHYSILIVKDASRILFCKKWMLIGYFADIIGEKMFLLLKMTKGVVNMKEKIFSVLMQTSGAIFGESPIEEPYSYVEKGSFASDNELLNKIWYTAAYDVRANLKEDYLAAIQAWKDFSQVLKHSGI